VKDLGFPLRGKKVTVSQAIAMAGGLDDKANGSGTKIFRYGESDETRLSRRRRCYSER